jgi:hypothetical protein
MFLSSGNVRFILPDITGYTDIFTIAAKMVFLKEQGILQVLTSECLCLLLVATEL